VKVNSFLLLMDIFVLNLSLYVILYAVAIKIIGIYEI
jgi:hypothetical protein